MDLSRFGPDTENMFFFFPWLRPSGGASSGTGVGGRGLGGFGLQAAAASTWAAAVRVDVTKVSALMRFQLELVGSGQVASHCSLLCFVSQPRE